MGESHPSNLEAARAGDRHAGAAAGRVHRRRVFYLSGFDPQGPAHYHRLYADEAMRQAAVGGYRLEVGPRRRVSAHVAAWTVEGTFPAGPLDANEAREADGDVRRVVTDYEFLRWDDIVRDWWPRSRARVLLAACTTTARMLENGVLLQILRTSWPAFLVLAMPPLLVLVLVVGALGLLGAGWSTWVAGHPLTAILLLAGGSWAWWTLGRRAEERVQMAWLMRSTRFILAQAAGRTPELERRLDDMASRVRAALDDPTVDEVLLVGHSSGAILAVSVAARSLRGEGTPEAEGRGVLSLLTLGECIPMLSYQPGAGAFRGELAALARQRRVQWVDVTAPPDGCCFALVDPTAVAFASSDGPGDWRSPKRLSARFQRGFEPARYRAVKRDKYRCHFQYLMAFDTAIDYDYFAITAGPLRLAHRFAECPSVVDFRAFQMFGGPKS